MIQFQDCRDGEVHEQQAKLVNKGPLSTRIKCVPPQTYLHSTRSEHFAIVSAKHPSPTTGLVAPGMALTLTVRYAGCGLGDLDDAIVVATEEESFKVPVLARCTPPNLCVQELVVVPPCWVGMKADVLVSCCNKGGSLLLLL